MAGYEDTKQKIISTLMGRPNGTEIQPENHQDYALNMLDYIRSLELIATSTLIGTAESNTTPVQPNSSRVCYIAGVAQNQTVVFENFIDENGNPISVTTGDMEGVFVILMWNTQYWSAQTFSTNIISQAESSTFYYNYNIKKTYSSVSAMNADKENPIGTDGKYIKVGDIVTVVNSTTPSENGFYSYEGSENGWLLQSGFSFEIVQTTGTDVNKTMSQKAITDELANLANNVSSNFEFINYMPGDLKITAPGVILLDKNIILYNSKTGGRAYLYPQDTVFPKEITIPNRKIMSLIPELLVPFPITTPYLPEGSLVEKDYGSNLGDFIPIFGQSNGLYVGVFTRYLLGEEYASLETVSTLTNNVSMLNKNGKIYSMKGVYSSVPEMDIGEYYLHSNLKEVFWKNTSGNSEQVETSIGDVILINGIRYVKTIDGWDVEKNAKDKLEYENVNAIYSYADGVVTKEDINGWGCGSINVKKGDIFSIKGQGGNSSRLWIYQDSEGNDIDVAPSNAIWFDMPYSFICTHDGVIYYNSHPTYLSTSEVYCTAKTPEKIETNKISIRAICSNRYYFEDYSHGDLYFSTTTGRLYENKDGESVDITETVIDRDYDIYNQEDNTTYKYRNGWLRVKGESPSMSHFQINHEMKDVSTIISDFSFDGQTMPQVYGKYDELVSLYPDYVSRVDAAELAGITYPRYANGVAAGDADYLETPAYKTYLYKFIDNNTIVGNDTHHQKFKIFIVGAVHGQERVSSITTYLFAKQLCEALDSNFFHLRNSFDVYIMPCTNGYGLLHNQRNNANDVNINRNYPTRHWKLQELGTDYGGETPGSEFETQLVVALTDIIKPHVPMDWHNYGNPARQFYMTPQSEIGAKIGYKALADCSHAFIKNLPQYFGEKFQLFMESSGAIIPSHPISPVGSSTDFWYYERNNHFGCTYEIANAINFWDGEYFAEQKDMFGNDTMSVAEYTIRTIIFRIAEYIVSSDVNSVCNWTHKEESLGAS